MPCHERREHSVTLPPSASVLRLGAVTRVRVRVNGSARPSCLQPVSATLCRPGKMVRPMGGFALLGAGTIVGTCTLSHTPALAPTHLSYLLTPN